MGGTPPPFAENSAKIINLIFEPFPYECFCYTVCYIILYDIWAMYVNMTHTLCCDNIHASYHPCNGGQVLLTIGLWG